MSKKPQVVFRTAKLKSWGDIGAAASHNLRTRPTPNASGAGGFIELVPLAASPVDAARRKIGDQKIRKNAVLAVEILISASPEYFRPDDPERAGYWEENRLAEWRQAMEPWIKEKFPNAISVVLHLDESTPHYQIIEVPLDAKGKLNARAKWGGPSVMREWQTEVAKPVAHLGIERGVEGSYATHTDIGKYYHDVNAPLPEIPEVSTPRPTPLPPRTLAEKTPLTDAKKQRDALEAEQAAQTEKRKAERLAQQTAKLESWEHLAHKATAFELAEKRRKEAEATAAKLAQQKKIADTLRALPLDQVLKNVYGAELEKGSSFSHASRKYVLADGRKIAVSKGHAGADVWIEQGSEGQRGAINLVMHLDNLPYKAAVRLLAEHFDSSAVAAEHAGELVKRATADVQAIKKEPVTAPPADPTKWPRVRKWLSEVRGMPRRLIDKLHSLGLIYADSRGNATFIRTHGGAFQRGTGDVVFHRSIGGAECGPFIVPGTGAGKKIILVEAPLDAIAVVAAHSDAMAIASGGDQLPPAKLVHWVPDGAQVLAGHDADKRGDQLAAQAANAFGATRLKPSNKDWAATIKSEPWRVDPVWEDVDTSDPSKKAQRPDLGPS